MKMTFRKLILCFILSNLHFLAFGANETSIGILRSTAISNSGLDIRDQHYDYMVANQVGSGANAWDNIFCLSGTRVVLSADIDSDGQYHGSLWWVRIPFTVELRNEFGNVVGTETGTLEVRSDENNRLTDLKDYVIYKPHTSTSARFLRAVVDIGTVTMSNNLSGVVPSNVIFKAELEVDRSYHIATNIPEVTVTNFSNISSSSVDYGLSYTWPQDFAIFNWSYVEGAESYDLEYLFVDLGSNDHTDVFDYDFKNATRVNTSKNRYKLPLAFPKGWILYRVRGVGKDCSGNHVYGSWSSYSTGSATGVDRATNFPKVPSGNGQEQIFGWPGMEVSFNWIHNTEFAEEAKRSSSLTFYDGTNKGRQYLTELSTSNRLLVSQTLYDFQGRPAVNVIPTPIANAGLHYYGPLNYYSANVPFDRNHFDLDLGYPAMSTQHGTGAANYYSTDNPNASDPSIKYLPDAGGYPYTQDRYLNDGTDRVKAQGGIGPDHHINSTHETRILYGTPGSQKELDRLFGNNVGFSRFYTKEIVTDPNGIGMVSYKNMQGQVIATGLAGGTSTNMYDVDGAPAAETINANMLDNTLTLDRELVTKKKMLVSSNRSDAFVYSFPAINFDPSGLTDPCLTGFGSKLVKFDLSIQIYDEDGLPISLGTTFPNGVEKTNISVGEHNSSNITFPGAFAPGTYTIVKKLSVNEATAQAYKAQLKAHIIANAESCGLIGAVPQADCSCEALCEQSVIKDPNAPVNKQWYIAGTNHYFTSYQNGVDSCKILCENPLEEAGPKDECTALREIMLQDVSPDGQYFDYIPERFYRASDGTLVERNPGDPSYNQNFWLSSFTNSVGDPVSISDLDFYDANNNLVGDVSLENIRDLWEDSFAETLLPYHPEYCALEFYCSGTCTDPPLDLDKKDYATIMLSQTVYNPLNMAQVTSTSSPSSYQPHLPAPGTDLYNTNPELDHALILSCSGNSTIKDEVQTRLLNYLDFGGGDVHSIWYFLDDPEGIAPGTITVSQTIRDLYIKFHGDGASVVGLFNDGSLSKYDMFRSAYLFFRDLEFYKKFKDECTNMPFENGDQVPNQEDKTFGDEIHEFSIRFPKKTVMEEYLTNGVQGLNTLANTTVQANTSSDEAPYNTECVCGQLSTFLIQRGDISPGQTIADLTVTSAIATDISTRFGITVTTANITAWKNECTEVTSVGVRSLIENNQLPVAFLCGAIAGVECSCNKLLALINEGLNEPVSSLSEVTVDQTLLTHLQTELDDNTLTIAQIQAWISECTDEVPVLANLVNLIYSQNYSTDLLCFEEVSTNCVCERLTTYAIDRSILGEDTPLHEININALITALQADGYLGITSADVQQWLDVCSGSSSLMINELLIYYKLPALFLCLAPDSDLEILVEDPCEALQAQNNQKWQEELDRLAEDLAEVYLAEYYKYALDNVDETFTDRYSLNEYYYTLYYYDQAGNLTSTVPPLGVDILTEAEQNNAAAYRENGTGSFVQNAHTYLTQYEYNSLGQMIWQKSPDAGETFFWYDNLGRMVLSQNSSQDVNDLYSYMIYDQHGRLSESGQIDKSAHVFTGTEYEELYDLCRDLPSFTSFVSTGNRDQVTFNYYDKAISTLVNNTLGSSDPKFLQNRVASSLYIDGPLTGNPYGLNPTSAILTTYLNNYHNAVHFAYDIHGDVKTMLRDVVELGRSGNRFFRIDYEYDPLTSNITKLCYQKDRWDAFYQRYSYDAENLLTEVQTSLDNVVWSDDAKYFYYPTNKISRVELGGQQKIQGVDYAHSIQNWTKGVNSDVLDKTRDIGGDGNETVSGNLNKRFAEDAFGFSLHYYNNDGSSAKDYRPIGSTDFTLGLNQNNFNTLGPALYNGNISRMVTALQDNNEVDIPVNGTAYKYDRLNRIKRSRTFLGNPDQLSTDGDFSSTSPSSKYKTLFSYDFNGNISTLKRYDETGALMDDLSYVYDNATSGSENNQLLQVTDGAGFLDKGDLKTQSANNYDYDPTGNLIRDNIENISSIEWTLAGKVRAINFSGDQADLEFQYDPLGNRIMKIVRTKTAGVVNNANLWEYYHYINDASGSPITIYKETFTNSTCLTSHLAIADHLIYGSSRVANQSRPGVEFQYNFTASYDANGYFTGVGTNPGGVCSNFFQGTTGTYSVTQNQQVLGYKAFELSNHLGSVLSTVSDRKYWSQVDEVSVILSETYEDDPRTWSNINNGQHYVESEQLVIIINEREDGIQRTIESLNEACSYEICLDLSTHREGPEIPLTIRIDGKEYSLEYGVTNCFTVSGILSFDLEIFGAEETGSATIDNFTITSTCPNYKLIADVLNTTDYYPFGMVMPGRSFNAGDHRYGFNGKEKDDEVSGTGNSIHFEFREYDPRLGRFKSIDPWSYKYAYQSPYVFAHNSPIVLIEWMGLGDPPSSTPEEATEYLNSLEIKDSEVWTHITADNFLANVQANIDNPSGINQGQGTYFCGIAVALSYIAEKDPKGYAELMVSLYNTGEGTYGEKTFTSSDHIREAAGTLEYEGLTENGADQMALMTIAENYQDVYLNRLGGDYEEGKEHDPFWAGTAISEFKEMMNDFGFNITVFGADILNGPDYFASVKLALANSQDVFLFVNSPMLKRGEWYKNWSGTHYMRIQSIVPEKRKYWFSRQTYTMNMWDYGAWRDYTGISRAGFNFFTYGVGHSN